MKSFTSFPSSRILLAAIFPLAFAAVSSAQLALNATGTYLQNFNTLPTSGTIPWVNNTTLAGWYAQRTGTLDLVASTGSSTAGALYNFGSTGNSDRALGSLGTTGTGNVAWAVIFSNPSADPLTFGSFSFDGELWRRGATGKIDTLEFDYRIDPAPVTNLLTPSGWIAVNALDFTNPNTAGGAGALDGNNAANRLSLSAPLNLLLLPGQFVTFRWLDIDHPGTDNGLAIDNVSISYAITPLPPIAIPEPATYGLSGVGALLALALLRRKKNRIGRIARIVLSRLGRLPTRLSF